jgi:hypothetical protein
MPLPPSDDRILVAIAVGVFCVCTSASVTIAYLMGWLS